MDNKITGCQAQTEEKIKEISSITFSQIHSLTNRVNSIEENHSEKCISIENQISGLSISLHEIDGKHAVLGQSLKETLEEHSLSLRRMEESFDAKIAETSQLVVQAEIKSAAIASNLEAATEKRFSELALNTDTKLSDLESRVQGQFTESKQVHDAVQRELSCSLQILNEELESTKSDTIMGLAALSEKLTMEHESAVQSLHKKISEISEEFQAKLDDNTIAIAATNSALAASSASAKEMCDDAKEELIRSQLSSEIKISQDMAHAISDVDNRIENLRCCLEKNESEFKAAIEDEKHNRILSFKNAESSIRETQTECTKELTVLGEVLRNELGIKMEAINCKVFTLQTDLSRDITNSNISIEASKDKLNSCLDALKKNQEETASEIRQDLERVEFNIRAEHTKAVRELTENIHNVQGEFNNLRIESRTKVDGIRNDMNMNLVESKEAVQAVLTKASAELLLVSKEIRADQALTVSELKCKIADIQSEAISHRSELHNLIDKLHMELASTEQRLTKLVDLSKMEAENQASRLNQEFQKEIANTVESASSKIALLEDRFQEHSRFTQTWNEMNNSKIESTAQNLNTRLDNLVSELAKSIDLQSQHLRSEIETTTKSLGEHLSASLDEQKLFSKLLDEKLTNSIDKIQLQDASLILEIQEIKTESSQALTVLERVLEAAKGETSNSFSRLDSEITRITTEADRLNAVLSSTRNEMQLQLDACREELQEAVSGSGIVNAATMQQIEEVKEMCFNHATVQSDRLRKEWSEELKTFQESSLSPMSNTTELIQMEIVELKASTAEIKTLNDRIDEFKAGTILELEFLGKNIRGEITMNNSLKEEQILQAKQEMQAQVDLALLANNETIEHNRAGLVEIQKIISASMDSARSEWTREILQVTEESKLLRSALKIEVEEKLRQSSKESSIGLNSLNQQFQEFSIELQAAKAQTEDMMNQRLAEQSSIIQKTAANVDSLTDTLSFRITKLEDEISKSFQTCTQLHEYISQEVLKFSTKLSELQEQHSFCLTDIIQDKQELSEVQLALAEIRSGQASLTADVKDFVVRSDNLNCRVTLLEGQNQGFLNQTSAQNSYCANIENVLSSISESTIEWCEKIQTACLRMVQSNAAGILALRNEFVKSNLSYKNRCECIEAGHETLLSEITAVNLVLRQLPATCSCNSSAFLDSLEKMSQIAPGILSRVDSLLAEISVIKDLVGSNQSFVSDRIDMTGDLKEVRKQLEEVQLQHHASLSDMMGDRQDLGETQLKVAQLQSAVNIIQQQIADIAKISKLEREGSRKQEGESA